MVSVAELNERDIKSPFLPKAAFWGVGVRQGGVLHMVEEAIRQHFHSCQ